MQFLVQSDDKSLDFNWTVYIKVKSNMKIGNFTGKRSEFSKTS